MKVGFSSPRMMMSGWKAVLLLVVLLFATACAAATPTSAPSGDTVAPTEAANDTPPTAEAPAEEPMAGGITQALIDAAKAEGRVVLYGSPSEAALASDAAAFEAEYGIPVEFIRLVAGPLTQRVETEAQAGAVAADVVMSSDVVALNRWAEDGTLIPLPDIEYPDRTDHFAPVQIIGQGIIYNSDEVPADQLPQTWGDLLDPKWNGRIALSSPRIGPGIVTLYYGILQDEQYGRAFFEQLAAVEPRVLETDVLVSQSVASGEAAIGFTAFEYLATNIKRDSPDAPIAFTYLDIAPILQTHISMLAGAPHPNAGELFTRWMMTEAGQVAHNGNSRASSPLGDLPGGTLPLAPSDKSRVYAGADVAGEHEAIINLFDELFN